MNTIVKRNQLKKGDKRKGLTVKRDQFWLKRREVMEIIYSLKKEVNLPRIEVKIATRDQLSNVIGLGWTDHNSTILIDGELNGIDLYAVVLHEIVHTAFKYTGHNESCLLMSSNLSRGYTKQDYFNAFKRYAK